MPLVTIRCRGALQDYNRDKVASDVQVVISQISQLKLPPEHVSVFFPVDHRTEESPKEVLVTIEIYKKKGRTDEVFGAMAKRVMQLLKLTHFPEALVEINTIPVDPQHCCSSAP